MGTRPYVLLSCAMSVDGFIDDTTADRLLLSNDTDFVRPAVPAGTEDDTSARGPNPNASPLPGAGSARGWIARNLLP